MSGHPRPNGGALSAGPFRFEFAAGADPRIAEYRLRYGAFVEEHHWLTPGAAPPGLERDRFDEFSCAALVTHIESGEAAACQRLILPDRLPPDLLTGVEEVYRPLTPAPIDFRTLPRASWAEVSRLTIAPRFRSGAGSAAPTLAAITYASMALAIALERYVLFSISEPRTARLMRRLRFEMRQVGEVVDFHGLRAVFRIDVHEVLRAVSSEWRPVVDQLIELAGNSVGPLARRRPGEGGSCHAA